MNIAIVGLGIMGSAVANNLLRAGFPIVVYNRTLEKTETLGKLGARIAKTPREAAYNAEVVISIVTDDSASRNVWIGTDGILSGVEKGMILIESSTLSTPWVGELARLARNENCFFLDAPISGTKPQAEAGELTFFIGGERAVLNQIQPIFDALGKSLYYLGASGNGAAMKLINNLMNGVQIAVLAEGLVLAERSGLDIQQVASIIINGAPGSPIVKGKAPLMVARDYSVQSALHLMHKDLTYALLEGKNNMMSLPIVEVVHELYHKAMDYGLAENDVSGIIELLR